MTLTKFIAYYFIYTAVIGAVAYFLPFLFPDVKLLVSKFWVLFGFLAGLTFIAYLLAFLGMKVNPSAAITLVIVSIALKVVFCIAFLLIFSLNTKERGPVLVLNFFSLYLLFGFFEIYALLCNLRHQNK